MNRRPPPDRAHSTIITAGKAWWLDSGLAKLAFGRPSPRRAGLTAGASSHLAFLSPESLEIDLDDPQQREFGDYELLELIGQGGMGVVYRARQACLDREVAVKLLSAGPWASSEFVERFQHEAQAAARMEHPNIVTIYETGVHEDLNFFSMRLVHGGSLASLLAQRGKLSAIEAARLLRTVAEAVDYAHRLDVLHLDLKPGNVLIEENGEPQVADFGLARRFDEVLALDSDEVSGTPSYMSPEQAQARSNELSPATDIYGLGAVLYECLTGNPPFQGASPQETLRRVVTVAPEPPRLLRPTLPADLDAICLKCLAKDPLDRYRSARALADDLNRFLDGREVKARPLNSGQRVLQLARREPKLTALVSLLFFSLVFGFGATALQWKRAEYNAAASNALLWDSRRDEALRLEQDGKGFDAAPRLLANISEQEQAGKFGISQLERQRLGLLLNHGAVLVDQTVFADANPLALELSADGSLLAVGFSDQSVRWYETRGLTERGRISLRGRVSSMGLQAVPRLLRFAGNHRLRVTLDWLSNITNPIDGDTWLVDLDRATVVEPPAAFADFADAVYSPDGRFALLRNHQQRGQLWQVEPWRALSPIGPKTDQLTPWLFGPGARYAAFLDTGMLSVYLYRLPDLSHPRKIDLPGTAGVSAWSRSKAGRWLALGDFEGRVYVLETSAGKVRLFPTPRGREVTWVAFSEDDAWLAVATRDGTAYAFDVNSGNPLIAGQIHQDFPLTRVGISHRHRLLVTAGRGESALWRLPQQGPRAVPAQRIGASPVGHAQAGDFATAWSLETGLLASASLDGRLQLWRLPLGPTPPARAARQVPEQTWFDGHRLVDVEGEKFRLIRVDGGAPTRWVKLPQAPGFAELLAGGRELVLSVGAQLWVFEPDSLKLRYPPIPLVASPERLVASGSGQDLVLSFSRNRGAGFEESLQVFDLRTGRRRGGQADLAAPLRHMVFSKDGSRLLAVGPATGATTVLSAADLRVIGDYPHDEFQPVVWAGFDGDSQKAWLVTQARDPRLGSDSAILWDPLTDEVVSQRATAAGRPLGVIATARGPYVAGSNQDVLDPGGAHARVFTRLAQSEPTAILALSADGRLLAHAFRREVQLHEVSSGVNLGRPLQADSDANDTIVQLAFSTDGRRLLARSSQGHWRVWTVAARRQPAEQLRAQLTRMVSGGTAALRVPSVAERQALRAADPGPWPAPEARPVIASLDRSSLAIPLRSPAASPVMVDLGDYYTSSPETVRNPYYNVRPQMRPLPTGVQRIDGIDYDLRGLLQYDIRSDRKTHASSPRKAIGCIPVAAVPTAALRLLLQISTPIPVARNSEMALVRLHYLDGGVAELALRSGLEVPGFSGRDQDVRMALATDVAQTASGYTDGGLSNPRLANPFPDRLVRCIEMEPTLPLNPVLLLAITLEPVPGWTAGRAASAATSSPVSRIPQEERYSVGGGAPHPASPPSLPGKEGP